MLTKDEYYGLLKKIMETGGLSEAMEEDIQKLKDDYDEREGMLSKENVSRETSTDEGVEENADKGTGELEVKGEETIDWKSKYDESAKNYDELKRRYTERFFSSGDEAVEENVKDTKRDGTEQTFEDLWEKREGN